MEIGGSTKVADVATAYPGTIKVFQKLGIDFCCGGQRPLGEVCAEKGLPVPAVARALADAIATSPTPVADWTTAPLPELLAFILERYHVTLREELPRLQQMMDKVARVHGERHAELTEVAAVYRAIHDDLGPHMMKEEQVLFPYIQRLSDAATKGQPLGGSCFGSVENPVRMMEYEHETVGAALKTLRRLTADFIAPADACNTFRGLYHGFAELERELMEHIHLENNVLHPRAVEMEKRVLGAVLA